VIYVTRRYAMDNFCEGGRIFVESIVSEERRKGRLFPKHITAQMARDVDIPVHRVIEAWGYAWPRKEAAVRGERLAVGVISKMIRSHKFLEQADPWTRKLIREWIKYTEHRSEIWEKSKNRKNMWESFRRYDITKALRQRNGISYVGIILDHLERSERSWGWEVDIRVDLVCNVCNLWDRYYPGKGEELYDYVVRFSCNEKLPVWGKLK